MQQHASVRTSYTLAAHSLPPRYAAVVREKYEPAALPVQYVVLTSYGDSQQAPKTAWEVWGRGARGHVGEYGKPMDLGCTTLIVIEEVGAGEKSV
jgi:hypothetical protein